MVERDVQRIRRLAREAVPFIQQNLNWFMDQRVKEKKWTDSYVAGETGTLIMCEGMYPFFMILADEYLSDLNFEFYANKEFRECLKEDYGTLLNCVRNNKFHPDPYIKEEINFTDCVSYISTILSLGLRWREIDQSNDCFIDKDETYECLDICLKWLIDNKIENDGKIGWTWYGVVDSEEEPEQMHGIEPLPQTYFTHSAIVALCDIYWCLNGKESEKRKKEIRSVLGRAKDFLLDKENGNYIYYDIKVTEEEEKVRGWIDYKPKDRGDEIGVEGWNPKRPEPNEIETSYAIIALSYIANTLFEAPDAMKKSEYWINEKKSNTKKIEERRENINKYFGKDVETIHESFLWLTNTYINRSEETTNLSKMANTFHKIGWDNYHDSSLMSNIILAINEYSIAFDDKFFEIKDTLDSINEKTIKFMYGEGSYPGGELGPNQKAMKHFDRGLASAAIYVTSNTIDALFILPPETTDSGETQVDKLIDEISQDIDDFAQSLSKKIKKMSTEPTEHIINEYLHEQIDYELGAIIKLLDSNWDGFSQTIQLNFNEPTFMTDFLERGRHVYTKELKENIDYISKDENIRSYHRTLKNYSAIPCLIPPLSTLCKRLNIISDDDLKDRIRRNYLILSALISYHKDLYDNEFFQEELSND